MAYEVDFLRIVLKVNTYTPTTFVLNALKWTTIEQRWRLQKVKLMYDILHKNAPKYLQELFTFSGQLHQYRTRNADNYGVIVPIVRSENGKKAFSFDTAVIWNSLPRNIRSSPTKQTMCSRYLRELC